MPHWTYTSGEKEGQWYTGSGAIDPESKKALVSGKDFLWAQKLAKAGENRGLVLDKTHKYSKRPHGNVDPRWYPEDARQDLRIKFYPTGTEMFFNDVPECGSHWEPMEEISVLEDVQQGDFVQLKLLNGFVAQFQKLSEVDVVQLKRDMKRHAAKEERKKLGGGSKAPERLAGPEARPALEAPLTPAEEAKRAGNDAFKEGRYDEAVAKYTEALELDETMVALYNNRAMAHLKLTEYAACEADCGRALERDPENIKALMRRASAREAMAVAKEDYGEVLHDLATAVRLEPGNRFARREYDRVEALYEGADGANDCLL